MTVFKIPWTIQSLVKYLKVLVRWSHPIKTLFSIIKFIHKMLFHSFQTIEKRGEGKHGDAGRAIGQNGDLKKDGNKLNPMRVKVKQGGDVPEGRSWCWGSCLAPSEVAGLSRGCCNIHRTLRISPSVQKEIKSDLSVYRSVCQKKIKHSPISHCAYSR